MMSRILLIHLLFFHPHGTLAWDGCTQGHAWRCGDKCILVISGSEAECKCGGEIFNHTSHMWCCHDTPCRGRGPLVEGTWYGQNNKERRLVGAECNGTALRLEQACNQTCNKYEDDWARNYRNVMRSYLPCKTNKMKIEQCIREDQHKDGKLNCHNRADEDVFQTGIGNTSSLLLDLDRILIPCKNSGGYQGFKCSGSKRVDVKFGESQSNCLQVLHWCSQVHTCDELLGTTATGKTNDPQLCRNQSFWEQKSCGRHSRCTGETSGQCVITDRDVCFDGSSEIKLAQGGDCGEDLKCRALGGKYAGETICLKDRYKCDQVANCKGWEDETNCTEKATSECWHSGCDQFYRLAPDGDQCDEKDSLVCTARDGRWAGRKICLPEKFKCDNYLQCGDGKDEEGCEGKYKEKRIFRKDHHFICTRPFLSITSKDGVRGRFFPMRAIR